MALPTLPTPGISTGWGTTINAYLDALRVQVAEAAGIIKAFGGTTVPANHALCNGAVVARTGTYANLFAAIGTRYGAGDGATTFGLPDLRGRTAVGIDATQTEFDATSAADMYGGAKTHALSIGETPGHTHDMSHDHGWSGSASSTLQSINPPYRTVEGSGPNLIAVAGWPLSAAFGAVGVSGDVHAITANTGSGGSGAAHNNLQPYGLVHWVITLGNA